MKVGQLIFKDKGQRKEDCSSASDCKFSFVISNNVSGAMGNTKVIVSGKHKADDVT